MSTPFFAVFMLSSFPVFGSFLKSVQSCDGPAASSLSKWTACFCVSSLKITQTAGWAQQKTTADYDDSTTLYSQVRVCMCVCCGFMPNKLYSAFGEIFAVIV